MGRQSTFSQKIADKICEELSTTDKGLDRICRAEGMPNPATVYRWLESNPDFREKYARARELQADFIAAQVIEISNNTEEGTKTKTDKDGNVLTETGDMVEHRRLKIDARKWYASKLAPKKYGDRVTQELTGENGGPIRSKLTIELVPSPRKNAGTSGD